MLASYCLVLLLDQVESPSREEPPYRLNRPLVPIGPKQSETDRSMDQPWTSRSEVINGNLEVP